MKVAKSIMYFLEELKIPLVPDYGPEDWKDWFHYIFFSPDNKIRLLLNISLSGKKGNGLISVTCAITHKDNLISKPKTHAFMKSVAWHEQEIEKMPVEIKLDKLLNLRITDSNSEISVELPNQLFAINFKALPYATPILINELFPYGDGFIGWGFMPGMSVHGKILLNNDEFPIDHKWFCYHDRNYGRFRWGDKSIGWVWWVAHLKSELGEAFSFVFHLGANKDHSVTGSSYLFVYINDVLVKTFMGAMVDLELEWSNKPRKTPILPGSMATLFYSRKTKIPEKFKIIAKDDLDEIILELSSESDSEIIIPDFQIKQYSFLKELNGKVLAKISLGLVRNRNAEGSFFAEYVH